ncbi:MULTISPECIES: zf-HC2 domain-containing protein [Streptomyces]|uniref:Zf-HC2 domain-containing protein n=1 Tax=Streptomyces eurythermus TaxID=42237 RepID=A0ABW6YVU0_9ACTN|nr:zf-HC2 domain-containing protein [Streptomyces lavenduligriseus]
MNGPHRSEGAHDFEGAHENAHGAADGRRDDEEPGEHREGGTGGHLGPAGSGGHRGPAGSGGRFGPPGGVAAGAGRSGAVPGPRIPTPRTSVEDTGLPLPARADLGDLAPVPPLDLSHDVLKSLLGAWALTACSAAETAAVEEHLGGCGACADEARRLREAVGLLHQPESLDLDPGLRTRVLESCLRRRPPRIPVPDWAAPYDAETARLDALLQDFRDAEWRAPVELRWFENDLPAGRRTTVAGVIAHLLAVDGLIAAALGLADPLARAAAAAGPAGRTEAYWRSAHLPPAHAVRGAWREQSHALVRTVSFTGGRTGGLPVSYGEFTLPLHDAMLDRAFECWVHAEDIAKAVDYPYAVPTPRHLHRMIELAARVLPTVLAERRRAGLSEPARHTPHLVPAGAPGRSLRLEIEGDAGGEWLIPLDSPAARGSAELEVARVVLDGVEFCKLAAGHVSPEDAAAGQEGDRRAIRDVLYAAASLSRM